MLTIIIFLQSIFNITVPSGFTRITDQGFGNYLRSIHLKSDNTVYLYNGQRKGNQQAQFRVLDISVGDRDLQQCADAVMRLRGEYLFSKGLQPSFRNASGSYITYQRGTSKTKFFDEVFSYCNTWSLERQMKSIPIRQIKIGDVLIKGGFPGHCVIVVDMAQNRRGEKIMMLAQSYMPAQDIHILKGPIKGVWYPVQEGTIETPEWRFHSDQAMTW